MPEQNQPLDYARQACETMMRTYKASDLPPKGHFHYHQGVFLSGVYQTWLLDGNLSYFQYIQDWVDSVFDEDGKILEYSHADLDDIQPGILLFPLLDKTGDSKYRKAIESVAAQIPDIPRNELGGFWHKVSMENQMWLDGLYMAGPFMAEYAKRMARPDLQQMVIQQALLMTEKTRDNKTGLLYHAWDACKKAEWANPETGLASQFWGRSIGWVPVALLDDLDFIEPSTPGYKDMVQQVQDLLAAVCGFQSDDGRWFQVVDKPYMEGNWLENSCSCLFTAAICKAVRKGLLGKEYAARARRGFEGVINSLAWSGEDIQIGQVCIGTCVGSYEYYCQRPCSTNDLHGVGAFLLMCTEAQQMLNSGASW